MVEAEKKAEVLQAQLEQQTKKIKKLKLKIFRKEDYGARSTRNVEKLKELEKQERELKKKLANAKPEEKAELELQLKQLTQGKFTEV